MKLIIKHTLKSVWAHKTRTFLLLFCVSICSLSAMLCFDMSGSLESAVKSASSAMLGKADIVVSAAYDLDEGFADSISGSTVLTMSSGSTVFTRHIDGTYDMLTQRKCSVIGVDIDTAKAMGVLPDDAAIGDMQAAVSKDFADEFGYSAGDTITLYNDKKQPAEFTVCALYGGTVGLFSSGDTIVISLDSMSKLYGAETPGTRLAYIELADDSKISSAVKTLENNLPSADVQAVTENEEIRGFIKNITRVFTVLFAVCLLLVVFVTVSASQRIITEKMPVIGTFRSLGIPSRLTYTALLGENIAYGLIGSLIGISVYLKIKPVFFNSMVYAQTGSGEKLAADFGRVSPAVIMGVVLFCELLECLCPIKEILLAVRTPIRDIIFSNKDTQYKHSKASTIAGIMLMMTVCVTAFFSKSFIPGLVCFVSAALGSAMLFPYILRFISGLLAKHYDRRNKPVARLAAVEAKEKKSTVGSAVLCFTAAALCIVVYGFASSMSAFYSHENSSADLSVTTDSSTEKAVFSYIEDLEGVEEVEYGYFKNDKIEINGAPESYSVPVYGWKTSGYELYSGVDGIPDDLGYNELVIGKGLARKYRLSAGDTLGIVFKADGFMPISKELKVRSIGLTDYENSVGTTIVISEELFKELYKDIPCSIYISSGDPKAAAAMIKNHSADMVTVAQTRAEYTEEAKQGSVSIMVIIDLVIALALGITFIGVVSNCLIGFEGRKRECAVLMSTALTRKRLLKMFLAESAVASGTALLTAIPLAYFMYRVFMNILDGLMVSIPVHLNAVSCLALWLLMWVVFTLSALFPMKALRKMSIAAQLKYE